MSRIQSDIMTPNIMTRNLMKLVTTKPAIAKRIIRIESPATRMS